jgi:hypothetical protein
MSLDSLTKYPVEHSGTAVYHSKDYAFTFGVFNLAVGYNSDPINSNDGSCCEFYTDWYSVYRVI